MATSTLRSLARIVRSPVVAESRRNLDEMWERLPAPLRTPHQMLGRQGGGCGATIGAMPRCDFACRGCYLGDNANRIPAQSVDEIKRQMRLLRPVLGNAGNIQLTDGEITLRPAEEVVDLLRYAQSIGLIPMLMTHGDSFRRRPGLLERYMVEGGLVEVSIHVDTTQRGRKGAEWRAPASEAALNPLRDEFAAMVREAKRRTGLPLRPATTMTVTRENLDGVADVMRWLTRNSDAFRMISFQPIAQVGRTEDGLGGGVAVEELWAKIAEGLYGDGAGAERLRRGQKWLGHSACNRFVHGMVARRPGAEPEFHPVREEGDPVDTRVVDGFLQRFGGVSFRRDSRAELAARLLGIAAHAPGFVARNLAPYARHWLARLGRGRPLAAARDLAAGRLAVNGLAIVSHHFMSRAEIETPLGQERLAQCVFHVPIGDRLVSMCEVNALGIRDGYYERIAAAPAGDATALAGD
ncbi:MAG: hypothetical protein AVDCRST_MAG11-2677 [uncultured Gemmatimonadaceae bacterium]|uniref:Radical SAM core domain-containing protein n=1 Tax=uncultured Gemmatimonadaceae bacterium TaxID=246130 RepID=A0A6J4LLV9_9BACT|nr:MAG: hypothetical protein AVDCRST_MAG11-2677 [uncultured Gemmatimonadaceae bacterium]